MKNKEVEESGISRRNFLKNSAALGVAATITGLPAISQGAESEKTVIAPMKPGMINSVLGPISPDKLGTTLPHEHFAFNYGGWYADETIGPYNFDEVLKTNLEVIKKAQKYGIKTIIDPTPNDCGGRDPDLYKALAKQTGMNIICCTGLYTDELGAAGYFKEKAWMGEENLSKMIVSIFVKEITDGIGKSGVRAGVLKVGTSDKMTKHEERVHKAAAIAQMTTGVPIITHTTTAIGGVEQADFLLKQGADPKKVMIGHVSNSKDIEYHKAILAKGVYIGFDRIGLDVYTPAPIIIKNVAELCKLGYANKIMLSHDTVNYWVGRQTAAPEALLKALANWRIDFISEKVLPLLKEQGITDEQIKVMMVDNPKRLFMGA